MAFIQPRTGGGAEPDDDLCDDPPPAEAPTFDPAVSIEDLADAAFGDNDNYGEDSMEKESVEDEIADADDDNARVDDDDETG